MLIQPFLTSVGELDNQNNLEVDGRSTLPDMMVVSVTTTLGGSVNQGGTNILSTDSHQISVNITNQGVTTGQSTLFLNYDCACIDPNDLINTGGTEIELDPFEFQTFTFSYSVSRVGVGQKFLATLSEAVGGEDDISNNFHNFLFDVENLEDGDYLGDDLPLAAYPPPRLSLGSTTYEAIVRNAGNIPVNAVFDVTMTPVSGGIPITPTSGFQNLDAGSISYPANAQALSITFDSTSMVGSWWMNATVTFVGIGTDEVDLGSRIVNFSEYRAEIIPAPDQAVIPGSSTMLTYLVSNVGELPDSYVVTAWDEKGWAATPLPPVLNLLAGTSGAVSVVITVPIDESRANASQIFVNITSADGYQLSSNNLVMAGDLLLASVTANTVLPVTPVQPGNMTPIIFVIENIGNAPTSFDLVSGLGSVAEGWDTMLLSERTSVLNPGENESAILQVTLPPLSNPLNPAHQLMQGTQLVVWVQATATGAGVPKSGQTDVEVQPVIVVDPAIDQTEYILSEAEAMYGDTIQAIDFGVEMRHNLIDDPQDTSGANLSVGTLTFTPADSGGTQETTRWGATITPTVHSAPLIDENGEPVFSSLGVLQPSSDGLGPLAGTLEVPVTAEILDTTGLVVDSSPVTRVVKYVVPKYHSVEITEYETQSLVPDNTTTFNLALKNTGNGLGNYSLQVNVSENWVVTFGTSSFTISPEMSDWPTLSGVHIQNFTMSVKAPAGTYEGHIENVKISVIDMDSGETLLEHDSPVVVGKEVSAILTPSVALVNVTYLGDAITLLQVNNTGNTLSTFDVITTIPEGTPLTVTVMGNTQFVLKSGRSHDIRFEVTALEGASFDTTYDIAVQIVSGVDINLNGTIRVQVEAWHNLEVTLPEIEVTPGDNETIMYWVSNSGNLLENMNVGVYLETGWNVTLDPMSLQVPVDSSHAGGFTIEVPPISEENMLYNGEEFTLWYSLKNSSTGQELINITKTVTVRPFFALEVIGWEEELKFIPGDEKEITAILKNSGNADIVVNVSISFNPDSDRWQLTQPPEPAFTLALGQEKTVSFKVRAGSENYYFLETGILDMLVEPVDLEVVGAGNHSVNLVVERILDSEHYVFGQASTIDLPWSHVPSQAEYNAGGYPSTPEYKVELISSERFLNLSELNISPENQTLYNWTFTLLGTTTGGVALQEGEIVDMLGRARHIQSPPMQIVVNASNVEGVLPGDGYNLTLRLTHPTDGTSTLIKVIITLDNFADPFVKSIKFQEDSTAILEGESGQIVAIIRNGGTAITPYMDVQLICDGRVKIYSEEEDTRPVMALEQSTEVEFTWEVEVARLEWWQTSEKVDCRVSLMPIGAEGNVLENDNVAMDASVISWSPVSQFVSVGIVMTLFLVSAMLFQLGREREKLKQLGAYTGAAFLGMIFHLSEWTLLGPLLLVTVILWLIYNAYAASDELQIIHADYQRARLGQTTLFTEHFKRLKKSRQQLTIIFTLPLLGFLMTILGFPPLLSGDILNILSLILIIAITAICISAVLKYVDKVYGQVYSRLTVVQARLRSIERSLGDPARLLNEIANIDLDAVVEEAEGGDTGA